MKRTVLTPRIRAMLRATPEGMTSNELSGQLGAKHANVCTALSNMPDAYIDRWEHTGRRMASVWCVVVPPPHCPHPNDSHVPTQR